MKRKLLTLGLISAILTGANSITYASDVGPRPIKFSVTPIYVSDRLIETINSTKALE